LKRLDRFYYFPSGLLDRASHIKTYRIIPNCVVSDHLPVELLIDIEEAHSMGARYKMNSHYLATVWTGLPQHLTFFGKMKRLIHWYKRFCL
jgi:hypothetical protein